MNEELKDKIQNTLNKIRVLFSSNKKATIIGGGVLAVLVLILLFWGGRSGKEEEKDVAQGPDSAKFFNIGVLAPLQGEYAVYGKSIKQGATVAARVINEQGGILGRPVKLHFKDTRSKPVHTREFAAELIKRSQVSLLIGTAGEQATLAAAEVANELRVPFIYATNGPLKTCRNTDLKRVSDYVWGTGLTLDMTVEPFLIYLADLLGREQKKFRIYYFSTDDLQSRELTDFVIDTAESLSFATIADEYVDYRIRDYFQRIRSIFSKHPDLLFVSTSPQGTPRFMTQAAKLGVSSEMAVAGLSSFEEERILSLAQATDDVFTVSRYSHLLDNPENKTFLAAWKKLFPGEGKNNLPTAVAAVGGYGSLMAARAAFTKAGSDLPARFKEAMNNLEVNLPQGQTVMSGLNHLFIQPLYAIKITGGNFEIVEYLGDVAHPSLDKCSVPQLAQPEG